MWHWVGCSFPFEFLHTLSQNMPGQVWAVKRTASESTILLSTYLLGLMHPQVECNETPVLVIRTSQTDIQTIAHCLVGFMNLWCGNITLLYLSFRDMEGFYGLLWWIVKESVFWFTKLWMFVYLKQRWWYDYIISNVADWELHFFSDL